MLPDASVLVGGGGASLESPVTNLHSEIYYPPYLYNSSNEFRPRPVISSAPSTITIGEDFSVVSDSSTISRLINEGQIFRFIAKPAGPGYVSRMVGSALRKHRDLMAHPSSIARYAVEQPRRLALEGSASGWDQTDAAPLGTSSFDALTVMETDTTAVSGVAWLKRLFGKV